MTTKNIIYLAIAGIVVYIVWKKFIKKPDPIATIKVAPIVITEEVKTQGDIVNELAFARGN